MGDSRGARRLTAEQAYSELIRRAGHAHISVEEQAARIIAQARPGPTPVSPDEDCQSS